MDKDQPIDIAQLLNDYEAEHQGQDDANIWQDVILGLPGYDEDATRELDPNDRSDCFVADDREFHWDGSRPVGDRWA